MIKQILRLLCFTQIAFTQLVFAQTDLPMYGPYLPKQPAKKTKYICALAAVENSTGENLTSVYWDNKKMTNEANFNVSIKQLKYLISKKTCQHKIQTCRVIGENGKSAISIDGNPATPFSDNPTSTAGDMKLLKDATICNFEEPTYSVLTSDSRFAVYVDGNRARPFMANARLADEDLKKFIKAFNNNSDAIPSVATPTTTSKPPLVKQKINSEKTELNKLKNVQCWKGISADTLDKNKILCEKKMKSNQICQTSMHLHNEGAFDVCLQGFEGKPNRVVNCIKGSNLRQQTENLKLCRTQLGRGQICEDNSTTHGEAKYDVCIME